MTWGRSHPIVCAAADRPSGIRLVRTELSWRGKFSRSYWYIEQPIRGVYVVAVAPNNCVLLLKHYRAPFDAYFWEIPAGGIRPSETPFQAARRELFEETGAEAAAVHSLLNFAPSPGLTSSTGSIVLATGVELVNTPRVNPEIAAIEFVEIDAAIARIQESSHASGGSLLGLLMLRDAQASSSFELTAQ